MNGVYVSVRSKRGAVGQTRPLGTFGMSAEYMVINDQVGVAEVLSSLSKLAYESRIVADFKCGKDNTDLQASLL
jgi:hypothetical protein